MTHIIVYFILCRGDDFSVAFAHIDLYNVITDCVHILALTAIAIIMRCISHNPIVITISPNTANI